MLLVHNMAMLGAVLWLFDGQGLLVEISAWLSVHGTTEMFGILLSGAAGLHIGRAMAFPGTRPVLDAAAEAGRRGAVVMVGVVIMMIVAAFLEAFPRQLVEGSANRFMIGGAMLLFWLSYFFLYRPRPAVESAHERGAGLPARRKARPHAGDARRHRPADRAGITRRARRGADP
jgi:hypothetical protein